MTFKERFSVLAAGLALFSMFFGAGDLIWPLILGGRSGSQNFYAMSGLLITGVSLPLLGLTAMMMFEGDYRSFFKRIGAWPGVIVIFIIQAILGPIGSIPRLITLSHATLKPYLPDAATLPIFSVLALVVVLAFTIKRQRVIELLGLVLTPILLVSLGFILYLGLVSHPAAPVNEMPPAEAFKDGLNVGYNTLDLIASFIFAPLVLSHFVMRKEGEDEVTTKKKALSKMFKSSLIAAGLLCSMYVGLTYVSSYYTPFLPEGHRPEERLSHISMFLLGPQGALVSCIAVAMACLTTAIPLTSICADYIKEDLLKGKGGNVLPLAITLGISALIANLGFMGIAEMLSPALHILCPGLIVLSVLNIIYKLYEVRLSKAPVYVTFALSALGRLLAS